LINLLKANGVTVERVRSDLDLADLMQEKTELFFVDADFFESDTSEVIRIMRALVGEALICVYVGIPNAEERARLRAAGADCVIPKSADEAEFGSALRALLEHPPRVMNKNSHE
jgi:DNA-binding response OmpR family regulator